MGQTHKSIFKQILILLIFYFITFISETSAGNELIFGSTPSEPFLYLDGNTPKGFVVDVFNEMIKGSDIKAEIKLYPFKRVDVYLRSGKLDGTIAIFYKKNRESYLSYLKTPLIVSRTMVFTKINSKLKFTTVKDFYNLNIGKLAGWSVANPEFNEALKDKLFMVEETTEFKHSLMKLIKGRIDFFIGPEQLTKMSIKILKAEDKIIPQKIPLAQLATHMAVSRSSKRVKDPDLLAEKLDGLLRNIISDGTYGKLMKKYNLKSLR